MKYRLDDLGWFHFERLVQILLKAELGLAIESWGGHSDQGRDAYSHAPLTFPSRSHREPGPFVFQAKFVSNANAAGARPYPQLEKAVRAEVIAIKKRRLSQRWKEPKVYCLLTNSPLTSRSREKLRPLLERELPNSSIHLLGGLDICDLIAAHPTLVRAFPELLSTRDLDILFQEAVSRNVLERSKATIEEARDIANTFVPTMAYRKAWEILGKHHFVVLDGPPEMGKTAIARIITLAQIAQDWQGIECRNPDDFFSLYSAQEAQIFIADDAFGRTEYDVRLGRMWKRDMPRILKKLTPRHWLIWTSRKHILTRALKDMDLVEPAHRFPDPGEVIVTAEELSIEERSRILYRHAKAASLPAPLKDVIKKNARLVVYNDHFTPERIRRLIRERHPEVTTSKSQDMLRTEIVEAIRNPTERMRKSFRKLPPPHMWALVSLLEFERWTPISILHRKFKQFQPHESESTFLEAVEDLTGSFVKQKNNQNIIDWIHPSYRDLVIDEAANNISIQTKFLDQASIRGIQIAISEEGGSTGSRKFPMLGFAESWTSLSRRCSELTAKHDIRIVVELIELFSSTLSSMSNLAEHQKNGLSSILNNLAETAEKILDTSDASVDRSLLAAYASAARALKSRPKHSIISRTLLNVSQRFRATLEGEDKVDPEEAAAWTTTASIVYDFSLHGTPYPDLKAQVDEDLGLLVESIKHELSRVTYLDSHEEHSSEASRFDLLADTLSLASPNLRVHVLVSELRERAEFHRQESYLLQRDFDEDYSFDDEEPQHSQPFEIDSLFSDL